MLMVMVAAFAFAFAVVLVGKIAYRTGWNAGDLCRALFDRREVVRATMAQHRAEQLAQMWERRAVAQIPADPTQPTKET